MKYWGGCQEHGEQSKTFHIENTATSWHELSILICWLTMKLLLVFNPAAANGRAKSLIPRVENLFRDRSIDVETRLTSERGDATRITSAVDFSDYDGIVAAGGDGTLFEVLNGYFENPSEVRVPIGILPVGTGNAFCRDIDVETNDLEHGVELIAGAKRRMVDVGHCAMADHSYYFLNILGLGFVSDVVLKAHKMKFLGNVSYMVGVLMQIAMLKSHRLKIEIDGELYERDNIFCEISNTRYTSNFFMAPSAEIDDGKLDVVLLGKAGRLRLLRAVPTVFTGEHVNLPEVEYFQASHIKVSTDEPKALTPDGEVIGSSPMEVRCLPRALEIFA